MNQRDSFQGFCDGKFVDDARDTSAISCALAKQQRTTEIAERKFIRASRRHALNRPAEVTLKLVMLLSIDVGRFTDNAL